MNLLLISRTQSKLEALAKELKENNAGVDVQVPSDSCASSNRVFFSVLGTSRSASLDQSLGYGLCDRLVIVIFMFAQSFRVGNFQATRGFVTE